MKMFHTWTRAHQDNGRLRGRGWGQRWVRRVRFYVRACIRVFLVDEWGKTKSQLLSLLVFSYGKTLSCACVCACARVQLYLCVQLAWGANNLLEGTTQLLSASALSSFVYAHSHTHTETCIHSLVKPLWVISHEASCTLLGLTIPYLCYTSG